MNYIGVLVLKLAQFINSIFIYHLQLIQQLRIKFYLLLIFYGHVYKSFHHSKWDDILNIQQDA